MMSTELSGRVALVTGGATGIGRSVCARLAESGVGTVIVNYAHSLADAESLVDELRASGTTARAIQGDVSDLESVRGMFEEVEAIAGRLDYLVNNAGTTRLIPFDDLDAATPEVWARLLDTNLLGTFWCSRAARRMLCESRGAIVNIASIAGMRGVGSSIPYGATKAGVIQLTRSLAVALAPEIRVNAISAGTVRSGWHEKLVGAESAATKAAAEAPTIPLRRLATPEDIAAAVVSVLMLDFVTGENLLVDGGKSLLY